MNEASPSRFAYDPPFITFGRGCLGELAAELGAHDLDGALVVCGQTVGNSPAVIDPVTAGLGHRLAGVFAETTPDKRLETALDAAERLEQTGADCLIGVGGGSSLDVATVASVIAGGSRSQDELLDEFAASGTISVPATVIPVVMVPTTLAGAELSYGAGISLVPDTGDQDVRVEGGVSHPRLMPLATWYDPNIVETTPLAILAGSAMNGFDKGIETLYTPGATPVTDATAGHGLALLSEWLPRLESRHADPTVMDHVLKGTLLVQFGTARPDVTTLSIIHAFGHGVTGTVDVQQGIAHAILAPPVLSFIFDRVDGRRHHLAAALGVDDDGGGQSDLASAVVDEVERVRDALSLPSTLREIEGLDRSDLETVADRTARDSLMANLPADLEVDEADLLDILESAW